MKWAMFVSPAIGVSSSFSLCICRVALRPASHLLIYGAMSVMLLVWSCPPLEAVVMGGRCGVGAIKCPEELGTGRIGMLYMS